MTHDTTPHLEYLYKGESLPMFEKMESDHPNIFKVVFSATFYI